MQIDGATVLFVAILLGPFVLFLLFMIWRNRSAYMSRKNYEQRLCNPDYSIFPMIYDCEPPESLQTLYANKKEIVRRNFWITDPIRMFVATYQPADTKACKEQGAEGTNDFAFANDGEDNLYIINPRKKDPPVLRFLGKTSRSEVICSRLSDFQKAARIKDEDSDQLAPIPKAESGILPPVIRDENEANRISVQVLGRVVAFFVYSLIPLVISASVMLMGNSLWKGDTSTIIGVATFLVCELILAVIIAKGWLRSARNVFRPGISFSEEQFDFVANLVALGSLVLASGESGNIFRWLLNAAVLICVLVFFITKSLLMRRVRYKILAGGVVSVGQFFLPDIAGFFTNFLHFFK